MKKTGLLLLLVPTLFLASCQTTPKIDTIDEKEARAFIEEHFIKDVTEFAAPNEKSWVKWKITKDNDAGDAKKLIGGYIQKDKVIADEDGNKGLAIEEARRQRYVGELADTSEGFDFGFPGTDAVIGMNKEIFENLYKSGQNEIHPFALVYKPAGKGLTIISQSTLQNTIYTRTHYYNEVGQETKFEVNVNKENSTLVFTVSIEFKYN